MTPQPDQPRVRRRTWAPRVAAVATASIVFAGGAAASAISPASPESAPGFSPTNGADGYTAQKIGLGRVTSPLHVAALGDSVPAGYGSSSYVNMVGNSLARQEGRSLALDNEAVSGINSGDAAQGLDDPKSAASKAVANADITIVEVGANDFDPASAQDPSCAPVQTSGCYSNDMAVMKKNVTNLLNTAKSRMKPGARLVVVGYWNNFEDGSVGEGVSADYVAQGRALARWTNSALKSIAQADGFIYADIYTPFFAGGRDVTPLLQADGDHPNVAGHRLIADAVLDALGTSARV